MKHRFLNVFENGVWPRPDRIIKIDGVEHDMDQYAAENGIALPDSKPNKKHKKQINIDIKEKDNADMGQQDDSGDHKVDGNGDSEVSE